MAGYIGAKAVGLNVTTGDILGDVGVGGDIDVNGGAVFNEGSADVDFRVESNGNANMLFVDGGNNAVGIKTNTPATNGQFSVRGAIATTNFGNVSGDFSDAATGSLKISHASNVVKLITDQALSLITGTSVVAMGIDVTGAVTKPLQPSFHVVKNADQSNIATTTTVTVLWQVETYDTNGDFASNTFTAPVTGKYILTAAIRVDSADSGSNHDDFAIATSNRLYKNIYDLGGLSGDPVHWTHAVNAVADMDAGDTAFVTFFQTGGTAQADIKNDGGRTYFAGILVG